jgi:tetratricopeptide (TPR) repeat protein
MHIAPGKHPLRAAAVVGGARLASADAQFGITARPDTALTSQEWEQVGRFHLEAGEFARAHEIARKLVEVADDTIGYVLLGDVFSGLGRHEEALAAYTEALASIAATDSDEPPDRILLAIERAHDRLGSSRR